MGTLYRRLTYVAAALALVVVVLGAYVRLSAAGLGCPDWPECYGHLTVGAAEAHVNQIDARFPNRPLQPAKAIKEMVHRYAAGTLGLLVLALVLLGWRRRSHGLPLVLSALIIFQALLGMWTVTLKLKPVIVTAHLIGGMSTLALLWWLLLDVRPVPAAASIAAARRLRPFAIIGLLLLAGQILLGGWTSSHYAGLVCTGFPGCNGHWWPHADYLAGFGTRPLDGAGLVAIQWVHRLGALTVLLYLGAVAVGSRRVTPRIALAVGLLLLLQVAIGIGNVLTGLPLPLAAAHNAGAALLLLAVVTLNHRLAHSAGTTPPREFS